MASMWWRPRIGQESLICHVDGWMDDAHHHHLGSRENRDIRYHVILFQIWPLSLGQNVVFFISLVLFIKHIANSSQCLDWFNFPRLRSFIRGGNRWNPGICILHMYPLIFWATVDVVCMPCGLIISWIYDGPLEPNKRGGKPWCAATH